MGIVNIVRPREPRSPLDMDGICPIHAPGGNGSKRFTAPAANVVRSWVLTKDVGGLIASGTPLRLDSVQHGGALLHDGAWSAVTRRFCVLDGPMAGTCWEETEWTSQIDDGDTPRTRSAEPVLASPRHRADRP